ncbi:DUF551 domain-containing protein [Sphingobium sp. TB-6]|uniref:hypothetical protein n=1 Tax=Sphingobium sp. TB-6 TaxID=2728850 RepID=UPI00146F0A00|nr:hypothetical protein [Sphingobium sp. TB-6]NML88720.1 DUF551 domain-containing protein [Sphingobium sp. TB-6]
MTNLLDLAARLEAACDITGKPVGRHMVPGLKAMSTAFAESDEQEARELAETHDCMARCIENEAKLFDDLAACAKEAIAALRSHGIPRDISAAPPGDGWILGYDPSIADDGRSPWVPMTRGDGGWYDDGVDDYQPTMWVPLPDPQPEPSGWRPAEGHVEIAAGMLRGRPVFIASIIKPDGTQDIPRDCRLANTAEGIRAEGFSWASDLNLPVVDLIDANVVPFRLGDQQS